MEIFNTIFLFIWNLFGFFLDIIWYPIVLYFFGYLGWGAFTTRNNFQWERNIYGQWIKPKQFKKKWQRCLEKYIILLFRWLGILFCLMMFLYLLIMIPEIFENVQDSWDYHILSNLKK